jgi:hypothetical protein
MGLDIYIYNYNPYDETQKPDETKQLYTGKTRYSSSFPFDLSRSNRVLIEYFSNPVQATYVFLTDLIRKLQDIHDNDEDCAGYSLYQLEEALAFCYILLCKHQDEWVEYSA